MYLEMLQWGPCREGTAESEADRTSFGRAGQRRWPSQKSKLFLVDFLQKDHFCHHSSVPGTEGEAAAGAGQEG